MANFCSTTYPWAANLGPNLTDHISGVFWAAFLLFSWTTGSIMSGALIERVRLSAYLILGCSSAPSIWILDAAWGWSACGWLTHALRLPRLDRVGSSSTASPAPSRWVCSSTSARA